MPEDKNGVYRQCNSLRCINDATRSSALQRILKQETFWDRQHNHGRWVSLPDICMLSRGSKRSQ